MKLIPAILLTAWTIAIFTASAWRSVAEAQVQHDSSRWHPPAFGHEHGDAPPAWLDQFYRDYPQLHPYFGPAVLYDGPHNTSPAENVTKHFAMKGIHLSGPEFVDQDGKWLDGYLVAHISSTPLDRGAMLHSARLWIADAGGGLTIRQGWINAGNVDTARVPKYCALTGSTYAPLRAACEPYDAFQRPIIFVVDQASVDGKYTNPDSFEFWYTTGVGVFIGWGINATTVSTPGEKATDADPHAWHKVGGIAFGQLRMVEVTGRKPDYKGVGYWSTPTGDYVADPTAKECSPQPCLLQYISPTYAGITGRRQTTWPLPPDGVVLPN